jgi:deoxyribodipyrimidine photo-lyase
MILVWHRSDLRTHDHPALFHAARNSDKLAPVFVLDPLLLEMPYSGRARIAFLHTNLHTLHESYQKLGSSLIVRYGKPEEELLKLAREAGAKAIYTLQSIEPIGRTRDARVKEVLEQNGIEFRLFESDTIQPPSTIKSLSGTSYKVFTPFWKTWSNFSFNTLKTPKNLEPHNLNSLEIPQASTQIVLPKAGEIAAIWQLEQFIGNVGLRYESLRDLPAVDGTSQLSSYFHLGIISPRYAAARADKAGMTGWVRELCWRDFYRHLLFDEPRLATQAFKTNWNSFPWRDSSSDLTAWKTGNTGYPIIDAGMRQLLETGWMHNRIRMIVASFLTKHLLIDWRLGEAHFNELLIDGDLASNNGGWQWTAGCGVDAAPYFRVFNPVTQGEKFDSSSDYIKRFVPELRDLEPKFAHKPWTMTRPPKAYADPILPLSFGRERFLETAKKHLSTSELKTLKDHAD